MVDLSIVDDACAAAFGESVTITPTHAAPFTVTAIVRRGERVEGFARARDFAAPAVVAEIRKSEWPAPCAGDHVDIGAEHFAVDHVGQDDAGICWTLDLKKLA
ncbi:MAG TPA: hypothetical protein VJ890_28200 [Vineibacter sp.]|nr:hypothetical protein [Vineibacter sp.]